MRQKALLFLEEGRYQDSFELCTALMTEDDDPSLPVLAATDLYYMEKYDEAELHFRDLARRMPDSSYIHSYIGKILDKKNDERAITEYALAVSLDPRNLDALRSFAIYLFSIGDIRRSLPVQKRIVELSGKEDDVRALMRALLDLGCGGEALALHKKYIGEQGGSIEHIDALNSCGNNLKASQIAERMYREHGDIRFLRKQLSSLAVADPAEGMRRYASTAGAIDDPGILEDYVRFLITRNEAATALVVCRSAKHTGDAIFTRLECPILASLGDLDPALAAYELYLAGDTTLQRIREEEREGAIREYRELLMMHFPMKEAAARFLHLLSLEIHADDLLAIAEFYENIGDLNEARSWYYRAYRTDFFKGGLAYAKYLASRGDTRETGKVLLYVFNNTRKASDIVKAGRFFINSGIHTSLPRVLDRLRNRLLEMSTALTSEGLELLAVVCLVSAASALESGSYAKCKQYCLRGLDVVPGSTGSITPGDFLSLIDRCKNNSIVDIPAMAFQPAAEEPSVTPAEYIARIPDLTDQEKKIAEYLKVHRQANEMDLRQLLGTRRVVGVVNQLIRKSAAKGVSIVRKQGVGDCGEIYEYTGP